MGTHNEPFVALAAGAAALAEAFAEAGLQGPPPADATATARVLAAVQAGLAAFSDVAFASGAVGLQSSGLWLSANVRLLAAHNRDLSRFELQRLHQWPQLVRDYVMYGDHDDVVRRLIGILDAPCWPLRPSEKEFASIAANLERYVRRAAPAQAPAVERDEDDLVFGAATVPAAPALTITAANAQTDDGVAADGMADAASDARSGEGETTRSDSAIDAASNTFAAPLAEADDTGDGSPTFEASAPPPASMPANDPPPALYHSEGGSVALIVADLAAVAARLAETDDRERRTMLELAAQTLQHLALGHAPDASAGLSEIGQRTADNVQVWLDTGTLADTAPLLLADLAALLDAHVSAPTDAGIADALIACLADSAWPAPLTTEDAPLLRFVLVTREDPDAALADALADDGAEMAGESPDAATDDTLLIAGDAAAGEPAAVDAPRNPDLETAPRNTAVDSPTLAEAPAATAQRCDAEQLGILATEFGAFSLSLDAELDAARTDAPADTRSQAVESYAELLERLAGVAETIGLTALRPLIDLVAGRARSAVSTGFDDAQRIWLRTFVQHVRAYVSAPDDHSSVGAMVEILSDGSWPPSLSADVAAGFEAALLAVEVFADPTLRPARTTEATADEVSLAIPADINPELLDGLLAELPIQSAEFAGAIARVASGTGSLFDLESAKRAAHTLKGAANTVGVKGIASLTHHVEDVLIALTKHSALPPRALCDTLLLAADCLESMSEALLSAAPGPNDAQRVLQQVLDWANRIDQEGADAFAALADESHDEIDAATRGLAVVAADVPATEPVARATEPGSTGALLRVPAEIVDELLRLVGETMIANTQIKEQLRVTVDHVKSVTKQNRSLLQLTGELETLVDIRGTTVPLNAQRKNDGFDALEFEHFNELHTVTRRLVEAATDSKELSAASEERLSTLAELLDAQGRLHVENQNTVMKTRMVPVSGIVSRLQRSVRQTCRLLDKRVELVVEGATTTVDGNILNELVDPLMHLLRNAIDHGIEAAGRRAARGKSAVGRIDLTFVREGTSIVVRCRDDGAGIDPNAVRTKAVADGIISPTQLLSDDELLRFVLLPGFSTRGEATQVSGRGIGMDAVYSRVLALKGTLRLHNTFGAGLTVELRLPASLMTTHGLLARVANQVIGIASFGVQDIRYVTRDQVRKYHTGLVYQVGTQMHGLDRLDELLGWPAGEDDGRDWFPALLVQTDTGAPRAVRVQEVLDSRELVVKDIGRYVAPPQGLVGVTILGDGSIAPVLDLPQLLRDPEQLSVTGRVRDPRGFSHIEARLSALVVDDSLSARRAAAQVMRDAGFDVRTAIDGMEAAAMLEKRVPDVILVDMEMPRMNGLEFTTHVRSREATRNVPVIMITSRSTEKHRKQADAVGVNVYLTKPFSDDELLRHVERLTSTVAAR